MSDDTVLIPMGAGYAFCESFLGIPAATLAGLRDGSLVAVSLKLLTEAHACMRACGWQLAPGTETDGDGVLQMAVAEIEDQFGCMLAASEAPRDD